MVMTQYQKTFRKLDNHPDADEIKERIAKGDSPPEVCKMLVIRYPGDTSLWLKRQYLYIYRKAKHPQLAKMKSRNRYKSAMETKTGIGGTSSLIEADVATRIMDLTGQQPKPQEPRKDIPDETLLKWLDGNKGFITFVEDMIIERGEPVSLQEYQKEMSQHFLDCSRVVVCAGGQVGKDFMMQNFILWWAIIHAGSLQMVLCATQAQSSALKLRIEDKLHFSGDLQFAYAGSREKPVQTVTFKNGSTVLFLTARSQVAGYTNVDLIWINEARFIKPEEVSRVSPLLGIGGGKLFVLSRPLFRRGYFWDCYRNPAFKTMKLPTEINIYFDKEVLESDRRTMSPHLFRADYMAEFADAGSAWFPEASIDKCSMVDYDFKGMTPEPMHEYSLGIDPARLADVSAMVVTGRHRKTGAYKVAHVHGFTPDSSAPSEFIVQYAYIQLLDRMFGLKYITPEYSGLGIPYSERLEEEWRGWNSNAVLKPYPNMSLRDKIDLYDFARQVVMSEKLGIPRGADKLLIELKMTQIGASGLGKVRVETPITDDYADAFCLSLVPFKKPFEIGVSSVKGHSVRLPFMSR